MSYESRLNIATFTAVGEPTWRTAESSGVEAPPPRDIETMDGRPDVLTVAAT
jgi:hypothetical protein